MGHFVSIRGWLECDESDLTKIVDINSYYCKSYTKHPIKQETIELYQKGWRIPSETVNWTTYVFYGADIREYDSDFIKDQIIDIAKDNKEIEGLFYVDDDEGEMKMCWKVSDGKLTAFERNE